jgi:hypothetical protein
MRSRRRQSVAWMSRAVGSGLRSVTAGEIAVDQEPSRRS